MRLRGHFLVTTITLIVAITGCFNADGSSDNSQGIAEMQFGFASKTQASFHTFDDIGALALDDAAAVLVTIEADSGATVYDAYRIPLITFGEEFLSRPISLPPGSYSLVEFIVLDEADNAIYAAPLEGSELAHLVTDPLPITMSVTRNAVTVIRPEIVSTEQRTPGQFGYVSFGLGDVDIIGTLNFLIAAFVRDEPGSLELTNAQLRVTGQSGDVLYTGMLNATTNHVTVQRGHGQYTIEVAKEGYETFYDTLQETELASHFEGVSTGPLEVVLLAQQEPPPPVSAVCFSFVNTASEDLTGNTWFDACVDAQPARIRVELRNQSGAVVYSASGENHSSWTYNQITSTSDRINQHNDPGMHDRRVHLDNGQWLIISGKGSAGLGCFGSRGNGYVLTIMDATYTKVVLLASSFLHQNGPAAGSPKSLGPSSNPWNPGQEISWNQNTPMDPCEGTLSAFLGTLTLIVDP